MQIGRLLLCMVMVNAYACPAAKPSGNNVQLDADRPDSLLRADMSPLRMGSKGLHTLKPVVEL